MENNVKTIRSKCAICNKRKDLEVVTVKSEKYAQKLWIKPCKKCQGKV